MSSGNKGSDSLSFVLYSNVININQIHMYTHTHTHTCNEHTSLKVFRIITREIKKEYIVL